MVLSKTLLGEAFLEVILLKALLQDLSLMLPWMLPKLLLGEAFLEVILLKAPLQDHFLEILAALVLLKAPAKKTQGPAKNTRNPATKTKES